MSGTRIIKYQPALNEITGGITATLLLGQLEYWFSRTGGEPFYKFLAPCEDECYREGDSWCEEMGFSKPEFRTAFAAIGKVYKSKKAYMESEDAFGGKLYLSYYDRIRRRTYYKRNHELLAHYGILLPKSEEVTPVKTQSVSPITKDYTKDLQQQSTTEDAHKVVGDVHHQVITLYHDTCNELPKVRGLTKKRRQRIDQLLAMLGGSLSRVQQLFDKVKTSDFLSGRVSERGWKAVFDWIITGANSQAILDGKYDTWQKQSYSFPRVELVNHSVQQQHEKEDGKIERSYPDMPSVRGKNSFTTTYTHNWNHEDLEALAYSYFEKL
ncbi:MAG: hypothetical protein ACRCW2_16310 [Cellulosilyticaceae bacterium]